MESIKGWVILLLLIFKGTISYQQVLLEDIEGDVILRNNFKADENLSLIRLNTGDQSLGFTYFTSTELKNGNEYYIKEFGAKARPTEGFASVFANKQFSPGVKFNYAFTKVRIFSAKTTDPFLDWGGVEVGYNIDRYSLFKRDTLFANQFFSKSFRGLDILLNYNYLITKGSEAINSRLLLNVKVGYSRRNNYNSLNSVNVDDVTIIVDSVTLIERQIVRTRNSREGDYKEFDAFPLIFSITQLPKTDPDDSPDAKKLRLGYTAYFKNIASNGIPEQDLGIIFYLAKQIESGVRTPVLGLNIQVEDPFNVEDINTSLQSRISVGFTSIFTL